MKRLKANQIAKTNQPGRYRVADTLYLRVAPGGSKQWVQRLLIDGKRRDIGLGSVDVVSVTAAKSKALQNRATLDAGGNPLADRIQVRRGGLTT